MANDEKETNVVENESPAQLQKVSDKVPVAKREVIEVNKDTIYARPYDMFTSKVDKEKYPEVEQEYRFEDLGD